MCGAVEEELWGVSNGGVDDGVDGALDGGRDFRGIPLFVFDEFGRLVELDLVEVLQEALRLRAKGTRVLDELAWSMECIVTYLGDNRASETDDHSSTDDFRLDDEVPRLVE